MSDNNMNGKDFLLGAVVGGIIGAVTALLLAPKSGSELRAELKDTASNVTAKTQELAHQVGERGQEIAKTVTTHTSEWVDKARDIAGTVANEVKSWKDTNANRGEFIAVEVGADGEETK